MIKVLNFLNRYKTVLGAFCLALLGAICLLTGTDLPNFQEPTSWLEWIKMVIAAIGVVYTPLGVVDKVAKARAEEMREKLIRESPVLQAGEKLFPRRRW